MSYVDGYVLAVPKKNLSAFVIYKSRKHRDQVNKKVMSDPRLQDGCDPEKMPFDVKRMTYGGFEAIVEY